MRENLIERILGSPKRSEGAYYRWTKLLDEEQTPAGPLTPLQNHLRRHPVPGWVWQQVFLNSYPKELMLRNHV